MSDTPYPNYPGDPETAAEWYALLRHRWERREEFRRRGITGASPRLDRSADRLILDACAGLMRAEIEHAAVQDPI